ncbi:GLUG motif-containing protein [Halonatronum saccharophilum]|uniref:GLUG motif-containing protein n=1 Tax=Halonatronum saccharophilum TaxID=150060 RepID=UPI0004869B99|nr:GLUG motif-containing protein [Halonatronum saccharophilum]
MKRLISILLILSTIFLIGCKEENTVEHIANEPKREEVHITGVGIDINPFVIYTLEGLEKIGEEGYPLDAHYKLGNNIDASITKSNDYNNGKGFRGIGEYIDEYEIIFNDIRRYKHKIFSGVFDGNGYEIRNLYINRDSEEGVGLFSVFTGTIKNLGLVDIEVKGKNKVGGLFGYGGGIVKNSYIKGKVEGIENVGGLAGYSHRGEIEASYFEGSVKGEDTVGGLVGYHNGQLINSYSEVDVKGEYRVGGLVGFHFLGDIEGSSSRGLVEGDIFVGGLVGRSNGDTTNTYFKGNVNGTEEVGGLVGGNTGAISKSYAQSDVKGNERIGGLAGSNINSSIEKSYSQGTVKGINFIGGLVGENFSGVSKARIKNSYSQSNVEGEEAVGGLVGYNNGLVEFSYWEINTSKQSESSGGIGKLTSEMYKGSTYEGWDFDEIWTIDGEGYPQLRFLKGRIEGGN